MDISIEVRRQADRGDLLAILRESFGGIYLWHARRILLGPAAVLAAERNRAPIGLVMMKMLAPGVGYVYYLAISRTERHRGIGGLLLDRCLSYLDSRGARAVLVSVTGGNLPSERLVASRGFHACLFRDLARRFGAAAALRLWMGMTVAPGERVFMKLTGRSGFKKERIMKLTIFGATGATGKQLIERALAAGNDVVAFARDPSKIGPGHERLTIIQGELSDTAAIERAVRGTDAVISVLGPRPREDIKSKPLARGMINIIAAMRKNNVRRLIISSTPSAADPNDLPDFRIKILITIVKSTMRPSYEEIVDVARIVRESDTDWTIVRVSMLNNNSESGRIRAGYLGRKQVGTNISRADLAAFLLDQARDTSWLRHAPAISN